MLTDTRARNARSVKSIYHINDHIVTGLKLVVYPTGRKVWQLRLKVGGKAQAHTLGAYPANTIVAARQWAGNIISMRDGGFDPRAELKKAQQEAAQAQQTVAEAWELYFEHEASKRRTSGEKRRLWNVHWRDSIGNRPLLEIDRDDISATLAKHQKVAPAGVQQNYTTIRRFFRWCVTKGYDGNHTRLKIDPAANITSIAETTRRDRVMTHAELRKLLTGIETLPNRTQIFIKILVFTGVRRREAAEARWSEFDLEQALWTIPGSRTKNNKVHIVPLSSPLLAEIKTLHKTALQESIARAQRGTSPKNGEVKAMLQVSSEDVDVRDIFLFPSARTAFKPMNGFAKLKITIDTAIGPVEPWTFHDVRRTVSTLMASLRVRPEVIEAVLNHVSGAKSGVAGIYNRWAYIDEKKEALDILAHTIKEILSNKN